MLRSPAFKALLNKIDANTFKVGEDGTISIGNIVTFKPENVKNCKITCPTDAVKKRVKVCITIPDSCECPEEFDLTVIRKPDLTSYRLSETFDVKRLYQAVQGVVFPWTAIGIAAYLANAINSDPNANVIATVTQVDPEDEESPLSCLILESKSETENFDAYLSAGGGTITVLQEYVKSGLSAEEMAQRFPIQPGQFASMPDLPLCGEYCRLYLKVVDCCSLLSDAYDLHGNRAVQGFEGEFEIYMNVKDVDFVKTFVNSFAELCNGDTPPDICNCLGSLTESCFLIKFEEGEGEEPDVINITFGEAVTDLTVTNVGSADETVTTEAALAANTELEIDVDADAVSLTITWTTGGKTLTKTIPAYDFETLPFQIFQTCLPFITVS